MTTSEKIAYLKGLAEGLGLGRETKEEKLIAAIIDTLDCVARDLEDLEEVGFDLGEEIDAISDDLDDLESLIYDDYDECCCGGHDDGGCCHEHGHGHGEGECCHGHGEGGHRHGHGDGECCHEHGHGHSEDECCHGHNHGEDECCHEHGEGGHRHGHGHEGGCCHGHEGKREGHGGCCGGHRYRGIVMYEVTCPACDKTITLDEDVLNLGSIECPSCGGLLEFDFEGGEPKAEEE